MIVYVLTRQLNVVPTAKLLATLQLAPLLLGSSALASSALLLLQQTLTMPSDVPTRSCKGLQDSKKQSQCSSVRTGQRLLKGGGHTAASTKQ